MVIDEYFISEYCCLLIVIILMVIGGYSIGRYWWVLIIIILLPVGGYSIGRYWWVLIIIILLPIGGYFIHGYCIINYTYLWVCIWLGILILKKYGRINNIPRPIPYKMRVYMGKWYTHTTLIWTWQHSFKDV
jgi:hypothetical protein